MSLFDKLPYRISELIVDVAVLEIVKESVEVMNMGPQ